MTGAASPRSRSRLAIAACRPTNAGTVMGRRAGGGDENDARTASGTVIPDSGGPAPCASWPAAEDATGPPSRPQPSAASSNSARVRPARPKASASNRTDIDRGRRTCPSSRYLIARVLSPEHAANSSCGLAGARPTRGRIGPMSPVSRGRKKKRPTTRPPSARRVLPGLDGVHAELLGTFRPAVRATDPLEVEVLTSDMLGSWWKRLPPGEDPDAVFGEGAIGHAARAGTREAMALLRALAVLGVTPAQGERTRSMGRWRGFGSADRLSPPGYARCQPSPKNRSRGASLPTGRLNLGSDGG